MSLPTDTNEAYLLKQATRFVQSQRSRLCDRSEPVQLALKQARPPESHSGVSCPKRQARRIMLIGGEGPCPNAASWILEAKT